MKRHPEWGNYSGPGDSWEGYSGNRKQEKDSSRFIAIIIAIALALVAVQILYLLNSHTDTSRLRGLEKRNQAIVAEMGRKFDACMETTDRKTCVEMYSSYFILPSGGLDISSTLSNR